MTFTSAGFLIFIAAVAIIHRALPKRCGWGVLLAASLAFYALGGVVAIIYITLTAAVVFLITISIQKVQDDCDKKILSLKEKESDNKDAKKLLKARSKKTKKAILSAGLFVIFGVLVVLKYTNFVASLLPIKGWQPVSFFIPLGISFYTFSAASYLFDVYNNKLRAERNYLKTLLCVSYFPSIVQGPINRFGDLRKEFFENGDRARLSLEDAQFAIQRILWGMIKKLVIADRAAQVVTYIFAEYEKLPWFAVALGLVMYSIQLYGDFSGGLDVALGASELFGVKLKENFRQPYFSQSIAEF